MRKAAFVINAFLIVAVIASCCIIAGCGSSDGESLVVDWIWPNSGKAGTEFVISGEGFGEIQGKKSYVSMSGEKPEIADWSNDQIIVKVPDDMDIGAKGVIVYVNKMKSNELVYEVIIRR
ncbi:MAG: IPT/TIG domain-containing protein [Actinobacteria bacterium]|nr:IPT/TIG domain-containing protein [Actinomycetota bacterium]